MVSEEAVIVLRSGLHSSDVEAISRHVVQATAHQIGMTTYKPPEARYLRAVPQRRTVALIQFLYLLDGEILECQSRSDIEGGLVCVRNEEVRFRRISHGQGEPAPRTGWVCQALVI